MATATSDLTTFSSDSTVGTAVWGTTPGEAQTDNDVYAELNPAPLAGADDITEYLKGVDLVTPPPAGSAVTAVRVKFRAFQTAASNTTISSVCLVTSAGVQTGTDVADDAALATSETLYSYAFSQAQLVALGVNLAEVQAATFGAVVSFTRTDSVTMVGGLPKVDHLYIEVDYTPSAGGGLTGSKGGGTESSTASPVISSVLVSLTEDDEDEMPLRYEPIATEALPSCTVATNIFANAPADTEMVYLTIRTGGLTLEFLDGSTPTAGANGHDYGAGERVEFRLNQTSAKAIRAIQTGGTTTGWITYFKG